MGEAGAKRGSQESKPRHRTGGSGAGVSHALVPGKVARTPQNVEGASVFPDIWRQG
jgi:hypothetical protein